jgi:hypothetical protein
MPEFIHDELSKKYLGLLLDDFGDVKTGQELFYKRQEINVFFTRNPESTADLTTLGLLGKIASKSVLIAPYYNAVTPSEIRRCMGKLYFSYRELEPTITADEEKIIEEKLFRLWILTSTASDEILKSFKTEENLALWGKGIYFLGYNLKTVIVVIDQLPETEETVWLRVLGKGNVQKRALEEIKGFPDDNPYKKNTLEIVYNLLAVLDARQQEKQQLNPDEEEFFMYLSTIYFDKLKDVKLQGMEQGLEEGLKRGLEQGLERGLKTERRNNIESLLRVKFGEIDSELMAIIPKLLTLKPAEFTPLILQSSKEQLINRFSS